MATLCPVSPPHKENEGYYSTVTVGRIHLEGRRKGAGLLYHKTPI